MEFLFELLFQIIAELGFEAIFRVFGAPFERRPHPVLAGLAYAIFGTLLGLASVWLLPVGILPTPFLRVGYMLLAPVALGFVMLLLRRWMGWRSETSEPVQFGFTVAFAFSFALVRYLMIY